MLPPFILRGDEEDKAVVNKAPAGGFSGGPQINKKKESQQKYSDITKVN